MNPQYSSSDPERSRVLLVESKDESRSICHSGLLALSVIEGSRIEILHGIYPERMRRIQNDKEIVLD